MKKSRFFLIIIVFTYYNSSIAQSISTSALADHILYSNSQGKVYAWGENSEGQLGNNSTTNSHNPIDLSTSGALVGKTITKVATGNAHSLALASDGTIYSWGDNDNGQLGINSTTNSLIPVTVNMSGVLSGKTIIDIAAGYAHSLALASDGTVYSWGVNSRGQLGDNSSTNRHVPVAVNMSGVLAGKSITDIAGGHTHSLALASDGTVYSWGYNSSGQLGDSSTTNKHLPVAVYKSGVLNGKTIIQISAGSYFSLALDSEGIVYSWGSNVAGQLGNNSMTNTLTPITIDMSGALAGKTITHIATGGYHSIAIASNNKAYCWGSNYRGQLGNNSDVKSLVPFAVDTSGVLAGKTISHVGAGGFHTMAISADGSLYAWGENFESQLGSNDFENSLVPVLIDPAALPVEFSSFTATALSNNVILNWETTTEVNNYGFEVERASSHQNGTTPVQGGSDVILSGDEGWETIGFVKGNGNSNSLNNYSFMDQDFSNSKLFYRLKQIDNDGSFEYSNIVEVNSTTPVDHKLEQNYPNPFNPTTTINYTIAQEGNVRLSIFNLLGEEVTVLVNEKQQTGNYSTKFDASLINGQITSGIYFYTITTANFVQTKKMILLK